VPAWIGIPLGLAVLVYTWASVVFTLVLPRAQWGPSRLSIVINRCTRRVFTALSRFAKDYETRDAILAPIGPIAVLAQLVVWLLLIGVGFVLILVPYTHDFDNAVVQVGAAMFTLGFARSAHATNDTVAVFAAASGFIIIALQIAYLPSLYSAFNRRETLISMLVSRAGEPSWGPEILIRHQLVGIIDSLGEFYGDWEQWAADLSESHSTYPVLLLFRSPDPWSSWIVGLLAVLDAAAMHLALCPSTAPSNARLCLRMGYTALRRVSDAIGWEYDDDPLPDDPLELTEAEFTAAVQLVIDAGFPIERSPEAAWPHFRGWRVNYESLAYRWAARVAAPPAPWSGSRPGVAVRAPRRPPHRSPDDSKITYRRPDFPTT
jgi:hypothetical protein